MPCLLPVPGAKDSHSLGGSTKKLPIWDTRRYHTTLLKEYFPGFPVELSSHARSRLMVEDFLTFDLFSRIVIRALPLFGAFV